MRVVARIRWTAGGNPLVVSVGVRAVLRDCFGLLRPGRILELAGAAAGVFREGLVAALGLATVPGGLWRFDDGVLEVSPVLFGALASRVSGLVGWPEEDVALGLKEGHRAACFFRGLLHAGFDLKAELEGVLRSRGCHPFCSDPMLLWFFGLLPARECLELAGSGRAADLPRDVSSALKQASDGVLVDVALRCIKEVRVGFDPFRVELLS